MMTHLSKVVILLFLCFNAVAQNETSKWIWGDDFGLDFMTNPPSIITNTGVPLNSGQCVSSMCDASGKLLLYSDGTQIYNAQNQVMANGAGLLSYGTSFQGVIIVKQPGNSNLYYVFTIDQGFPPPSPPANGLTYSIVDMNLAAGSGSVISKNVPLYGSPGYLAQKMTAVEKCNGDVWIMVHESFNNNYRAYLLTAAGITNTVTTAIGTAHNNAPMNFFGCIRFSPNGRQLAATFMQERSIELYDFDPLTGVLSNSLVLASGMDAYTTMGVEFSPDGSKLYATGGSNGEIYQYDLCASTPTAIVASRTLFPSTLTGPINLVRASDGKIYSSRSTMAQHVLGVFNTPNLAGANSGYQQSSIQYSTNAATNYTGRLLPNMVSKYVASAFTSSALCNTASFSPPAAACAQLAEPILSLSWNFGESQSGTNNVSTQMNPSHTYANGGTYTVNLVLNYACGSQSLTQNVVVKNCTGLNESEAAARLRIYPVPSSGSFQLESAVPVQFIVYNSLGQSLFAEGYCLSQVNVDLSEFPDGIYFIKVFDRSHSKTIKLVKSH